MELFAAEELSGTLAFLCSLALLQRPVVQHRAVTAAQQEPQDLASGLALFFTEEATEGVPVGAVVLLDEDSCAATLLKLLLFHQTPEAALN